jgi:hypothetical protein
VAVDELDGFGGVAELHLGGHFDADGSCKTSVSTAQRTYSGVSVCVPPPTMQIASSWLSISLMMLLHSSRYFSLVKLCGTVG